MIKLCRLFQKCTPNNITQGFHDGHKAVDISGSYGEDIVSPFNAKVIDIVEDVPEQNVDESLEDLRRGYGIKLRSIENPSIEFLVWHTLPIFAVEEGETVLQGQPICEMGNSGFVYQGGQYVEIDLRTVPPYKGTHAHVELYIDGERVDYLKYVDWLIPIKYDAFAFISKILRNFFKLLNK